MLYIHVTSQTDAILCMYAQGSLFLVKSGKDSNSQHFVCPKHITLCHQRTARYTRMYRHRSPAHTCMYHSMLHVLLYHIISPFYSLYSDGIDFLGPQVGLRRGCFISMDAVKWVVENVKGIGSRRQATKILQVSRHMTVT